MAVRKKYNSSALGRGLDNISSGRGLGLDALIDTSDIETKGTSNLNEITISQIEPNPNQPRHEFDEQALKELAMSIREIGIITPITVRQTESGTYQIIAGERRWRAAQIAGLSTLPAYIKTAKDDDVMEMALVENIQREDLNAIEIALAYQRLAETTGLTQEKISERVGKSRTSITNYMRLLKLPAPIQMALKNKEMDAALYRQSLGTDQALQRREAQRLLRAQGGGTGAGHEEGRLAAGGQEDRGTATAATGIQYSERPSLATLRGPRTDDLLAAEQGPHQHPLRERGRAGEHHERLRQSKECIDS